MDAMLVTFRVSKCERSNCSIFGLTINIPAILVTLEVLKLEILRFTKFVKPTNIALMSITLLVSKLLRSNVLIKTSPANI